MSRKSKKNTPAKIFRPLIGDELKTREDPKERHRLEAQRRERMNNAVMRYYNSDFKVGDLVEYGRCHNPTLLEHFPHIFVDMFQIYSYPSVPKGTLGVITDLHLDELNGIMSTLDVMIPDKGMRTTHTFEWGIVARGEE